MGVWDKSKVLVSCVGFWTLDFGLWTPAEEHRGNRELAVEPAAGLVEGFADEVGGKLFLELFLTRVRIAPLGERHRAAVVPAVDDFGDTLHPRAGGEGG